MHTPEIEAGIRPHSDNRLLRMLKTSFVYYAGGRGSSKTSGDDTADDLVAHANAAADAFTQEVVEFTEEPVSPATNDCAVAQL